MPCEATGREERQHCPNKGGGDAKRAVREEALRQHIDHAAFARIKHPVALAEEDFVEDREGLREIDHCGQREQRNEREHDDGDADKAAAQIVKHAARPGHNEQEACDREAGQHGEGTDDQAEHEEIPDIRHMGLFIFIVELRRTTIDVRLDDKIFPVPTKVDHGLMHHVAEIIHRHLVAHPVLHRVEDLIVLELLPVEIRRPVRDRLEARHEGDEDQKHGKNDAEKIPKMMSHSAS